MGKEKKTVTRKDGNGDVVARNDIEVETEKKKKTPDKVVVKGNGFQIIECEAKRGFARYKKYDSFDTLIKGETRAEILLKWTQKRRLDSINEVNRISATSFEIKALRELTKDASADTKAKIEDRIQGIINDVQNGLL